MKYTTSNLPALLIPSTVSNTMVFRSNAPALLPWYNIANSPDTCKPAGDNYCTHMHAAIYECEYLLDKWLMDSWDTKEEAIYDTTYAIYDTMYAYYCINCLTLFFTSRTTSKYGIPGFTINISAPSATSRSC